MLYEILFYIAAMSISELFIHTQLTLKIPITTPEDFEYLHFYEKKTPQKQCVSYCM